MMKIIDIAVMIILNRSIEDCRKFSARMSVKIRGKGP